MSVLVRNVWQLLACEGWMSMCAQAEREAMAKLAAAAEEEACRLKKKLAEAADELEEAVRKHLANQQRVQVSLLPDIHIICVRTSRLSVFCYSRASFFNSRTSKEEVITGNIA